MIRSCLSDSDIEIGTNEEFAGITWWKFFYGLSLCALVFRSLRILSVFRSLGLLVIVTQRMMRDVLKVRRMTLIMKKH